MFHSPWENIERVELGGKVPFAGPVPDGHGGHDVAHDEVVDALRLGGGRVRLDGRGVGRVHVLFQSSENSTLTHVCKKWLLQFKSPHAPCMVHINQT